MVLYCFLGVIFVHLRFWEIPLLISKSDRAHSTNDFSFFWSVQLVLDRSNSFWLVQTFWTGAKHFGPVKNKHKNRSKTLWTNQKCFGPTKTNWICQKKFDRSKKIWTYRRKMLSILLQKGANPERNLSQCGLIHSEWAPLLFDNLCWMFLRHTFKSTFHRVKKKAKSISTIMRVVFYY